MSCWWGASIRALGPEVGDNYYLHLDEISDVGGELLDHSVVELLDVLEHALVVPAQT